ncbi:MAG: hypothetical protein ACK54T_10400, partial [bacterium]
GCIRKNSEYKQPEKKYTKSSSQGRVQAVVSDGCFGQHIKCARLGHGLPQSFGASPAFNVQRLLLLVFGVNKQINPASVHPDSQSFLPGCLSSE